MSDTVAPPPPAVDPDRFFQIAGPDIVVAFLVREPRAEALVGPWLHVGMDSRVTAFTGKVEIGQNIRTSLSQVVAEELRIPLACVSLVMGDTECTPWDMGTVSSLTTRIVGTQLRRVAAAARELLLRLAAERWDLEPNSLVASDGTISEPTTGRTVRIGELAHGMQLLETVTKVDAATPPDEWTVAGTSAPRVDSAALVTGSRRYAGDLTLPGMLIGKVLRAPEIRATLTSVNAAAARAMEGLVVVHEGDFVGVAAGTEWQATQALASVEATWRKGTQPSRSHLFDDLRANPVEVEGRGGSFTHTAGDVDAGRKSARTILEQTYTLDFIAHAPAEPRAAVARWFDGKLTVWTATQRPFAVRDELAAAFEVEAERVRVIVPDSGCAFGGKHTGDAALEAARLARAAGRPVKVVWTRREEFAYAYFRPAALVEVRSGIDRGGTLTSWEFRCYNAGAEGILPPYRVANQEVSFQPTRSPLRQGPYRALAATASHFARETHVDELAHALAMDPVELRRLNLDESRLLEVLGAATDVFGWGRSPTEPGHGVGIACGTEKGGYIATCAEVAVDARSGAVHVVRVVEAFECGAIVNPRHLAAQVEGAIVQGLGGALFEAIDYERGRFGNASFGDYRVPRFSDMPQLEIVLLDRTDLPPAGAGESPIVCIAPAVGSAIFDATGIRLRTLPLARR
jgi:isoquinoline 1-oxidoreductase